MIVISDGVVAHRMIASGGECGQEGTDTLLVVTGATPARKYAWICFAFNLGLFGRPQVGPGRAETHRGRQAEASWPLLGRQEPRSSSESEGAPNR